jgi:hypothetical protein
MTSTDTVAQELGDYTLEVDFKEEALRVWTKIGMLDVKALAELEFRVEVVDLTGDDEEEEEVVNEEVEVEREGSVETSSDSACDSSSGSIQQLYRSFRPRRGPLGGPRGGVGNLSLRRSCCRGQRHGK